MITKQQEEHASLFVLRALPASERARFAQSLLGNTALRDLVDNLQRAIDLLALAAPGVAPPPTLRAKVLERIHVLETVGAPPPVASPSSAPPTGLHFLHAAATLGWKQLPVPGAWIKLLSLERERGYAVVLGKLDPGVRYPAHHHTGPENLYVLTGDLHIGTHVLQAGDFHHAAAGTDHGVNYSEVGCTLLAVLNADNPLVAFAMAEPAGS